MVRVNQYGDGMGIRAEFKQSCDDGGVEHVYESAKTIEPRRDDNGLPNRVRVVLDSKEMLYYGTLRKLARRGWTVIGVDMGKKHVDFEKVE